MKTKSIDVMRFLPVLFRYSDTLKLVSNPNVFLARALKAGYVKRIARGIYYNAFKELPQVEEVACFVRTPAYISCEWALNVHGVILQVPAVCSTITLSPSVGKRNTVRYQGIIIEYSKIAERLFCGFETKGGFNMAAPEKALLDAVYLRGFIPFPDELELERLNIKQLPKWLPLYPKSVRQKVDALFQ